MKKLTVHPNSTAARKWGRKTWETSLTDAQRLPGEGQVPRDVRVLYKRAAAARRRGDHTLASSLRALAMRARSTSHHCG